jgi:hypothetical protein
MLLLSVEELKELSGRKNKSKIKDWLRTKGVNYLEGADGYPKVSKELVEEILKGNIGIKHITRNRCNENALRELMGTS